MMPDHFLSSKEIRGTLEKYKGVRTLFIVKQLNIRRTN